MLKFIAGMAIGYLFTDAFLDWAAQQVTFDTPEEPAASNFHIHIINPPNQSTATNTEEWIRWYRSSLDGDGHN